MAEVMAAGERPASERRAASAARDSADSTFDGIACLRHGRRRGRRPGHEHVERARRHLRLPGGDVRDVADGHVRTQGRGSCRERTLERLRSAAEAHPHRRWSCRRAATRPRCRPRRGRSSRWCRRRRPASAGACAPRGGRRGRWSAGGAFRPDHETGRSCRCLLDDVSGRSRRGWARRARTRAPVRSPVAARSSA